MKARGFVVWVLVLALSAGSVVEAGAPLPARRAAAAASSAMLVVQGPAEPAWDLAGSFATSVLLPSFTHVAAGWNHTCALTAGGGVKCWGDNSNGQLGNGTYVDSSTPVDVQGLASGITAIAAGRFHTCALTAAGGLKCWGLNSLGQLGDGTQTNRTTPVDVGGLSGVAAIAAGQLHTCALTVGGGLKCWGYNWFGSLGDGTNTSRSTPVDVLGLTGGVSAIAAGEYHTCAAMTAGGAKCWGYNTQGQLGDGTYTARNTPADVVGLSGTAVGVGAGRAHSCAVMAGGGVRCWGDNGYGELGDGTTTSHSTAVDVVGLPGGVTRIAAGAYHTCGLGAGGVQCWGYNGYGQLGDGTVIQRPTPVSVGGLAGGVTVLAAGEAHTCAVAAGGVQCWGYDGYGQLGAGTITQRSTPQAVPGLSGAVARVATAFAHTCAVTAGGGVQCWGYNDYGQLGDGTTTARSSAVDVVGLGQGVVAVAPGRYHTCALTTGGGVKCWGLNNSGQLGDGTWSDRKTPVDVSGLGAGVAAIASGEYHTCVLTTGGGVKCWGDNSYGQLGDGTTTGSNTPVDVTGLAGGVTGIAVGGLHTCAVVAGGVATASRQQSGGVATASRQQSGGARCWGRNGNGQLGDGTATDRSTPVDVVGLANGVVAIGAGGWHTCALTTGGGIQCWGTNGSGQLGDGTRTTRSTPVDVVGLAGGVSFIAAGRSHTCALIGGGIQCWGYNWYGQVGDGSTTDQTTPVDVAGLASGVTAIAPGGYHTCALVAGGVRCWGVDNYGQLGLGTAVYRTAPVDVVVLVSRIYLPLVRR